MSMLSTLMPSRAVLRVMVARIPAIALLASAAFPVCAWANAPTNTPSAQGVALKNYTDAIRIDEPIFSSSVSQRFVSESDAEVIRAIEAFPEVVVFPIRVAGPAVAVGRNLGNKLALEAGAASIAVIYPEIAEPYRSVFTQIIGGIENKTKGRVANFAVGPNMDTGELNEFLRRQDTKVVIALGRQGMKAAFALNHNIGVVVGGVLSIPENQTNGVQVNSLSPDPALLFSRLKGMMPGARRVFTVYDPRQNGWMMRLAKEAARNQGLELVMYEAQDLRTAMFAYQEILASADSERDSIWLPQDSTTVEDGAVLPLVLQESWKRNLAVFSSSFGHVRRGVLFSLYPNNIELGRYLAGSALNMLASGDNGSGSIVPLREVLMAINLRTARHLGIDAGPQQKFDMAFPER